MKVVYKIISVFLSIAFVIGLGACENKTKEKNIAIVFSEKLLNVAEVSPEDWKTQLQEFGVGQYDRLYVSGNGKTVTMEITEAQKEYWLSVVQQKLELLKNDIQKVDDSYNIIYSGDYSALEFYYNLELPAKEAIYYVIYSEIYCVFGQLLNEEDPNNWVVTFSIYNSDTGKLVTSGDSGTGLSYETSDWEASE